jgi:hypothetical protein
MELKSENAKTPQTFGNFIHFAPALPLFTAVSMKAMPAMPSSTVGKS